MNTTENHIISSDTLAGASLIVLFFGPVVLFSFGQFRYVGWTFNQLGIAIMTLYGVWSCGLILYNLVCLTQANAIKLSVTVDQDGTEEIVSILNNRLLNWKFDSRKVWLNNSDNKMVIAFTNNLHSTVDRIELETPLIRSVYSEGSRVFLEARQLCRFLYNEHIHDITTACHLPTIISIDARQNDRRAIN